LSEAVGELFAGLPLRSLVKDITFWLLATQRVSCRELPHRTWEVVEGSGMGLTHSSAVVDAAFYIYCEARWAGLPCIASQFGILMYVRFRDDVLIIAADIWQCKTWLARLREYAQPVFVIELVDLSSSCVDMLAVRIMVNGSMLETTAKPPRSLGPPLSVRSAHPLHTLSSWPIAYLRSAMKLCSSEVLARQCVEQFLQRLTQYHEPENFVELIRSQADRALLMRFGSLSPKSKPDLRAGSGSLVKWLVLPFHPFWNEGNLNRRLRVRLSQPDVQVAWQLATRSFTSLAVRVAWASGCSNLQTLAVSKVGCKVTRDDDE
jgi:hypothetical protein